MADVEKVADVKAADAPAGDGKCDHKQFRQSILLKHQPRNILNTEHIRALYWKVFKNPHTQNLNEIISSTTLTTLAPSTLGPNCAAIEFIPIAI